MPFLRRVIELDPVNESAHWGLAVWARGTEESIEVGETYFNRFGDDQQLHIWVGLSYQALGDLARAQEHYQKARGLTSATSPSIRSSASHANLQGLLFSGLIYERLGDHIRARQTWQRGVELLKPDLEAYPDNLKRRVFLACFHGVLGEKAAFFAELERALSTNVNLWEFYLLAVVLARTGETERASELLLRIARQGRIRPDIDWLFETIVSLPAPRSDTFNELVETQTRRLREMY